MTPEILVHLAKAHNLAIKESEKQGSRGLSLAITKIDEATMWYCFHLKQKELEAKGETNGKD